MLSPSCSGRDEGRNLLVGFPSTREGGRKCGGQWGPRVTHENAPVAVCLPCPAIRDQHSCPFVTPDSQEHPARLLGQGHRPPAPQRLIQEGGHQGHQGLGTGRATITKVLACGHRDSVGHLPWSGGVLEGDALDLAFTTRDLIVHVSDQTQGRVPCQLAECRPQTAKCSRYRQKPPGLPI